MALPTFTSAGVLPPGDYSLTIDELRASHLVTGQGVNSPSWDDTWRATLVNNLEVLIRQLWRLGLDQIFVDGSFVEDKDHPRDIDGYFLCDMVYCTSGRLENDLNALDPFGVWTWRRASRRQHPDSIKAELPMWHQYRVELYPHYGQTWVDRFGNQLQFPSAFRQTLLGIQKGILQVTR